MVAGLPLDAHANLAQTTLDTAPTGTSGTSCTVATGTGSLFPAVPFNATIWPAATTPNSTNAEIIRVTAISTDTLTITRGTESSTARTFSTGDNIAATITVKTLTDVEARVFNVMDFGAKGDASTDDTTAIQNAIDAAMSNSAAGNYGFPSIVYFPPGLYDHHGISIADTVDRQALIVLKGEGRRLTQLRAIDNSDINLTIETVSGNIRDVTVTDLTLANGDIGLYADEMSYCTFRNVTFSGTETTGVKLKAACSANSFINCWWVHNQGESFSMESSCSATVTGGVFGEDSGHIQTGGILAITGTNITQIASKNPGSDADLTAMGAGTFYVTGNGNLTVSGCYIHTFGNCINSNYGDTVTMSGNRIAVGNSGTFFKIRGNGGSEASAAIVGNTISFADGCKLYDVVSGHEPLQRSVISNNTFYLTGTLFDTTFDDGLLAPINQNQIHSNTIRKGENPA